MMKKVFMFAVSAMMLAACTSNEEVVNPSSDEVRFYSTMTRATDTRFQNGDMISISAMLPSAGNVLKESGNYADNIHYVYRSGVFEFVPEPGKQAIKLPADGTGLAYYAVYPSQDQLKTQGTFAVQKDQRDTIARTKSDFCTVLKPVSTDRDVVLDFWHRLSRICVNIINVPAGQAVTMTLKNMNYEAAFDLNANSYAATGTNKSDIQMGDMGTTRDFEAILPPQAFNLATDIIITIGNKSYNVTTDPTSDTFLSGWEYRYNLRYVSGEPDRIEPDLGPDPIVVRFGGDIYPWNTALNPLDGIIEVDDPDDGDDTFPTPTADYVLYEVTYNHQYLPGGSNIFTIDTDKTFKRFYIGIKGLSGCLVCSPEPVVRNGRNIYTITVVYGPNFNPDMIMLISGEEENGYITLPFEASFIPVPIIEGAINVNLTFSNAKDVDLHLYMPDGEHIFYSHRGGTVQLENGKTVQYGLDKDSNAGCNIDNLNNENIVIPAELVQSGTYRVVVNMFSNCNPNTATSWNVVAWYNEEKITPRSGRNPASGVYPVGASNGDMTTVMEFTINAPALNAPSRVKAGSFVPTPLSDMDIMKFEEEKFYKEFNQK